MYVTDTGKWVIFWRQPETLGTSRVLDLHRGAEIIELIDTKVTDQHKSFSTRKFK